MSEDLNPNEGLDPSKQKSPNLNKYINKKYLNKKYLIVVLILLAIPLTVGLSLIQQDFRSRAGGYSATPTASPSPNQRLLSYGTDHVILAADEFEMTINGVKFSPANGTDLEVSSNAPFPPEMNKTTLELIWKENGVEMRMFMYLEINSQNYWYVKEIWTYNGKTGGGWVYFDGFPGADVGKALELQNFDLKSNSKTNDVASIHFKNLYLKPFLVEIPKQGYYIYRTNSYIKIASKGLTYGAYGLLFKDGNIVQNQAGYIYDWSVDNPNIKLNPEAVCVGGVSTPCGKQRVAIAVNSISDQGIIYLTVKDSQGNMLSSTNFGVNMPPLSTELTPTPSIAQFTPTPTRIPPTVTPTKAPPLTDILTPSAKRVVLYPTADSFVRSSAPTTNFGTQKVLYFDTNPTEIPYLKFNLSSLSGKTITKATLILKVSGASSANQVLRLSDNNSWTETGIKYTGRPTFVSTITSFIPKPVGKMINLDVKTAVNKKKGGAVTFGIVSQTNAKASIYSRESSASNRPQLVIEYR